ncbi:MAG: hypothetical protein IPP33_01155 [Flavobacteriales bacterium]|nr:hypothetical protein [Flavobacteriales bacterium]
MALHGYPCGEDRWTTVWLDSFHCTAWITRSQGAVAADILTLNVLGHYPAPPDPDRSWRRTLKVITHINVLRKGRK